MDNNLTEAQRWLQQAQYDVRAAAHNREGGFNEIACFLAQQAAEKALKAFLHAQGERPVLGYATHLDEAVSTSQTIIDAVGHFSPPRL